MHAFQFKVGRTIELKKKDLCHYNSNQSQINSTQVWSIENNTVSGFLTLICYMYQTIHFICGQGLSSRLPFLSIHSFLFIELTVPTTSYPSLLRPSTTQHVLTYSETMRRTHPETVSQIKGDFGETKIFDFSKQTGQLRLMNICT